MKINILDLIDFKKVDTLLEGFNKSTGFVTAILDLDGNVMSKSGWRQICTEFHRINPETSKKCTISDTSLAGKMEAGEKYHFYKCLNGLIDVSVPIVINGEHIANLFSGQFFFEEPDRDHFKRQAKEFGFNEEKYLEALEKVPVVSKEKVLDAMDFLSNMTRLISETTFQELEQIELNNTIRKSEEKFKAVFESANAGKSITLPTGEIDVNQAFCDMLGYSREELRNKKWQDLTPEDEILATQAFIDPLIMGEKNSTRFEKRYICKDGSYKWADVSTSIQRDKDGKPLQFITTVIDINKRKQAEQQKIEAKEKAEESEEKFRKVLEFTPIPIAVSDNNGDLVFLNRHFIDVFGYTLQDLPTMQKWFDLAYPDIEYRNSVLDDWGKKVADAQKNYVATIPSEYLATDKNGEVKTVEISAYFDKDFSIGLFQDITARKQAEEQLQKQNDYIKMILDNFPIGIATNEIDSMKVTYMNRKFSEIYGWPEDDFPYVGKFFEKVFPDIEYRQQLQARILADISSGDSERMNWDNLKITTKAGDQRIIYAHNIPLFSQNIMVSTVQDITDRKQAEAQLRFQAQIIENSPVIAAYHDKDLNMVWANKAYQKATGLSLEEIKGRKCYKVWNLSGPCRGCPVITAIETGENAAHELRPDNQDHWPEAQGYWLSEAAAVRDEHGTVIGAIEFALNITERKQAEDTLHQKMDELLRFQLVTVGRELKMIELKKEINTLLTKAGAPEKYRIEDAQ